MSELSHIQRIFWQAITGDGPVSEAALQGTVRRSAQLSPAQRVQIYADMGVQRLVEALAADFPNLAKALGPQAFHALARHYLARHPSEQPSIAYLGRHLATTLRDPSCTLPRPDLADLAALEWARSQVFEAPPAPSVTASVLTTLDEEALPGARFTFVPALQRLELAYDAAALWRVLEDLDGDGEPAAEAGEEPAAEAGEEPAAETGRAHAPALPPPAARATTVVVWRAGFDVLHTVLAPEAAEGLRRAQAGAPLEAVCEAFAALPSPIEAAFAAIGAWFADGWVASLSAGP